MTTAQIPSRSALCNRGWGKALTPAQRRTRGWPTTIVQIVDGFLEVISTFAVPTPTRPLKMPQVDEKPRATRVERDPLGTLEVPADALYGIQTSRAVRNFPIGGSTPLEPFIVAQVWIKKAAALTHKRRDASMPNLRTRLSLQRTK